jgi:hypothetical protein
MIMHEKRRPGKLVWHKVVLRTRMDKEDHFRNELVKKKTLLSEDAGDEHLSFRGTVPEVIADSSTIPYCVRPISLIVPLTSLWG